MNHEEYMILLRKVNQWGGVLRIAIETLEGETTEEGLAAVESLYLVYDSIMETVKLLDNTRIPKRGDNNEE